MPEAKFKRGDTVFLAGTVLESFEYDDVPAFYSIRVSHALTDDSETYSVERKFCEGMLIEPSEDQLAAYFGGSSNG